MKPHKRLDNSDISWRLMFVFEGREMFEWWLGCAT